MSDGLLDYLTQANHIAAGMNVPFGEALEMVHAAHDVAAPVEEPTGPITIDNVIYGVDFRRR